MMYRLPFYAFVATIIYQVNLVLGIYALDSSHERGIHELTPDDSLPSKRMIRAHINHDGHARLPVMRKEEFLIGEEGGEKIGRLDYADARLESASRTNQAPNCDEALSGNKEDGYRGCQAQTVSGKFCQKWTEQTPHPHVRNSTNFPNKGLGDHNYCRNPDSALPGASDHIWCYTVDPRVRWENCCPVGVLDCQAKASQTTATPTQSPTQSPDSTLDTLSSDDPDALNSPAPIHRMNGDGVAEPVEIIGGFNISLKRNTPHSVGVNTQSFVTSCAMAISSALASAANVSAGETGLTVADPPAGHNPSIVKTTFKIANPANSKSHAYGLLYMMKEGHGKNFENKLQAALERQGPSSDCYQNVSIVSFELSNGDYIPPNLKDLDSWGATRQTHAAGAFGGKKTGPYHATYTEPNASIKPIVWDTMEGDLKFMVMETDESIQYQDDCVYCKAFSDSHGIQDLFCHTFAEVAKLEATNVWDPLGISCNFEVVTEDQCHDDAGDDDVPATSVLEVAGALEEVKRRVLAKDAKETQTPKCQLPDGIQCDNLSPVTQREIEIGLACHVKCENTALVPSNATVTCSQDTTGDAGGAAVFVSEAGDMLTPACVMTEEELEVAEAKANESEAVIDNFKTCFKAKFTIMLEDFRTQKVLTQIHDYDFQGLEDKFGTALLSEGFEPPPLRVTGVTLSKLTMNSVLPGLVLKLPPGSNKTMADLIREAKEEKNSSLPPIHAKGNTVDTQSHPNVALPADMVAAGSNRSSIVVTDTGGGILGATNATTAAQSGGNASTGATNATTAAPSGGNASTGAANLTTAAPSGGNASTGAANLTTAASSGGNASTGSNSTNATTAAPSGGLLELTGGPVALKAGAYRSTLRLLCGGPAVQALMLIISSSAIATML